MENSVEDIGQKVDLSNRTEIARYLNEETSTFLTKLDMIWDEIGIDLDDRKHRGLSVIDNVKQLLDEMLKEADDKKNSLAYEITALMKELSELGKELKITHDYSGYESMPLNSIIAHLQKNITKYKSMHEAILQEIRELHSQEKEFCQKLGKKQKLLPVSPIPSHIVIEEFQNYLSDLLKEIRKREEIFVKTKEEIINIMNELKITASLEFEKKVLIEDTVTFQLSDENMKQLERFHSSLVKQHNEMLSNVADLREKISIYWERLEESPEIRSTFLKTYPGHSIETYQALKIEEKRCKDKIKSSIIIITDKMRQEIVKWWKECRYSDEQKKEFKYFNSDCYTEDLLTLHELYIDELKKYFETHKSIFDLLIKREELWKRLLELEEKAVNPDRFKNRGGQLLREEKERNSVRAKLPKVEQQLSNLVEDYELKTNKRFLIEGQSVADMIENDWDQFKENRHLKVSAKKNAQEMKTPMKSPAARSILAALSNGKNTKTPRSNFTTPKRRLAIPLFGSSSAKKNKSTKTTVPKVVVTASTVNQRRSLERRRRFERKSRSFGKNSTKTVNTTDYDNFEMGLENKTACRSTIDAVKIAMDNNNAGLKTPRRTPSKTNLRLKSPSNGNNRMTPAPGTLPIII